MTWVHAAPVVVTTGVLLLAPGYVLARVLGFARLQAAGGAPALTMAALGTLSVVLHVVGVPWRRSTVAAGVAVLLCLSVVTAAAGVYVSARSRGAVGARATLPWLAREAGRALRPDRRPWPALGAALVVTAVVVGHAVVTAVGPADTPMQASDGVWHLNALSYVRAREDAFPVGALAPMYWGEVHFYPTAWHGMAALIDAQPAVAANVLLLLGLAVVWPLGCASLLGAIYTAPDRGLLGALPLVVGVLASGGALGPVVVDTMVWPYAWAVVLLPGALSMVMTARPRTRSGRRQARSRTGGWAGAGLACLGLVAVHGASVFNLALTAVPAMVLVAVLALRQAWRRGGWSRARVAVAGAAAVVALGVGARGFHDQLRMLARFQRGGADPWVVLGEIVRDDAMVSQVRVWSSGWTALFVLACAGAVVACVRRRYRWAPLVAVGVGLLMVTSVMAGSPFQGLSSPWYVQRARLAPVLELALLVLVLACVEAACQWVRSARRRRGNGEEVPVPACLRRPWPWRVDIDLRRGARAWQRWRYPVALAVLTGVVLAGVVPQTGRPEAIGKVVRAAYQPSRSPWKVMLSEGEAAFIRRAGRMLPEDAVVLGVPTNGSAYFWSLAGRDVVYPTLRRYGEPDRLYVAQHAKDVMTDPQVCAALGRLGADYLYVDSDSTGGGAPGGGESPRFATTLDEIPFQALQVVAHESTWTLYRIAYCAVDDAEAAQAAREAAAAVPDPVPVVEVSIEPVPVDSPAPGAGEPTPSGAPEPAGSPTEEGTGHGGS